MNLIHDTLARQICLKQDIIQQWFKRQAEQTPLPIHCSVDLRDAGFKIAPVDCNLFPAGFNNICEKDLQAAPNQLKKWIEAQTQAGRLPEVKSVVVISEENTRNHFYAENLFYLLRIIEQAGFSCELGWPVLGESQVLESVSGEKLQAQALTLDNDRLTSKTLNPDLIILNNDFSGGLPKFFSTLEQPVLPSWKLGWHTRKKSRHFEIYNELAKEFSELIEVDPWMIQIATNVVEPVNFNESQGIEQTADVAKRLLESMKKEYSKRAIPDKPVAFIKSNQGTYGMGVMAIESAEELLTINRRVKNKMSVGKNRKGIEGMIVQEGIPTSLSIHEKPAEAVIYLIGCELIGGFMRSNPEKGRNENLNARGMVFKKFCMSDLQTFLNGTVNETDPPYRNHLFELVYGSIAKLSALAAGKESTQSASSP